ncbi:MAG TPA: hypothetical protein VF665_13510 [Longimicrobium sp.]|jgi:hypothetical protein
MNTIPEPHGRAQAVADSVLADIVRAEGAPAAPVQNLMFAR